MDRRQQRTEQAVFVAFDKLLSEKSYPKITVQDIIDRANIGRSTFYTHFETKDELLQGLCEKIFRHIVSSTIVCTDSHGQYRDGTPPKSVFCHLLYHIAENDSGVLGLLSSENCDMFIRYFKDSLNKLVREQFFDGRQLRNPKLPEDFLVNHISSCFVEMVLWWIKSGKKQAPEELDEYFHDVIEPIL